MHPNSFLLSYLLVLEKQILVPGDFSWGSHYDFLYSGVKFTFLGIFHVGPLHV